MTTYSPTTKTNNEFFSSSAGVVTFSRCVNHLMISVTGTLLIGFDNVNFMPLAAGNHELYYINAQSIYFSGAGSCSGWAIKI